MDLAIAADFYLAAAHRNIQSVRPGMHVLEVSSKTGQGMDETISFLHAQREASRAAALRKTQ